MKSRLPAAGALLLLALFSCSRKAYVSSPQEQEMSRHRLVAVLPAQMIYSGNRPKNLTADDIKKIEESESTAFQQSLLNQILRYANGRKYFTFVDFQDIGTTEKILQENNIAVRDAWEHSDSELTRLLGVDALVRMKINKKRYISDLASYGIDLARQIGFEYGGGMIPGTRIGLPPVASKTNDIYASCSVTSQGHLLWNDYYKGASDWRRPANVIIESITASFGRNFPYKQRR